MGAHAAPLLEVRNLAFAYPRQDSPALAGVTFSLASGELAVVAGPNGAGKSTLAFALNGTIPHLIKGRTGGEVRVAGEPVGVPRVAARRVGVVFQDFEAHLVSSTAALEVAFPLENLGADPARMRARVTEVLALVGLAGFEDRVPAELSGGEKQRLAIAAAIAPEPLLLVLDEPLTDLDPAGKAQVLDVVRRLNDAGVAVVLIEHDPRAFLAADRMLVLARGRMVYDGPPGPLLADPARCAALGVPAWDPSAAAAACGVTPEPADVDAVAERLRRAGVRLTPRAPAPRAGSGLKGDPFGKAQGEPAQAGELVEPFLDIRDLTSGYSGGPDILHGVTLAVGRGEAVALLGQNGSGKTALAKHAVGLIAPRRGEVRVAGRPARAWGMAELSRRIGYVFQNPDHQIFSETVGEEVAFGVRNLGLPEADVAARVAEALAAVELAGREREDPFALPKGERQRLAVASLLAYRPDAVFLDEPTTGLDAREAERMMRFLRGLNERGLTILLITHAMWAAAEYADRVVVLAGGRVALDGPAREVFAREDELAALALAPPPAAALARRLGGDALAGAELRAALEARTR